MKQDIERITVNHLEDTYQRLINYLRISITDQCNLRCFYCTPKGPVKKLPHSEILRYEEILKIVRIGGGLGITKVRVTGGEPLVRKGCADFLEKLTMIPGIDDISLTTNGILLKRHLNHLRDIGIKRLNISLDTLDAGKYKRITGHDAFDQVWSGILYALQKGFFPIKINVVAMNGINDDELKDLAALTLKYPLHIRFIEQMSYFDPEAGQSKTLAEDTIKAIIAPLGELDFCERNKQYGPASRYRLKGAKGEIGFISPVSHHFCKWCNRLRLTSDGCLRSCLLSDIVTDIKTPLRNGATDAELAAIIVEAVAKKPLQKSCSGTHTGSRMFSIGG